MSKKPRSKNLLTGGTNIRCGKIEKIDFDLDVNFEVTFEAAPVVVISGNYPDGVANQDCITKVTTTGFKVRGPNRTNQGAKYYISWIAIGG